MAKQDITVRQLVDKVISRELALPEMQRRYVWTSVKVRDLLDSLYRGYPSGAILVWEADPGMDDRSLQISGVNNNPLSGRLLLLDGQQRITSLTAILTGNPITVRNKRKPIDILFNLDHPLESTFSESSTNDEEGEEEGEEEEDDGLDMTEEINQRTFIVASRALKNNPQWISVSEAFIKTESQLLKPMGINSDDPNWDKYTERIRSLKKIQDYQYVMQILDKKLSYNEVTDIFVRVNSLGAKLRGSDLALAQITSKWKGFIGEIDDFSKEFDDNADYLLDSGILVKTLVAFATNQSKFKTVGRIKIDDFKVAWDKTKIGLSFAINLLKANARIENLRIMGSPFLLIPLAYFSVLRKEKLSKVEVREMLLWFYVAHMKGRYSYGATETLLDADLSALKRTKDFQELLKLLRIQVRDFLVTPEEIAGKTRRSSFFSMMFFISKQYGIKDWFTGIAISEKMVGKSHALQFHHIFPKALLRKIHVERKDINDIANLAFIGARTNKNISAKDPGKYLIEVKEKRGDEILDHHNIPSDVELWKLNNYQDFLTARRLLLVKTINTFIRKFM